MLSFRSQIFVQEHVKTLCSKENLNIEASSLVEWRIYKIERLVILCRKPKKLGEIKKIIMISWLFDEGKIYSVSILLQNSVFPIMFPVLYCEDQEASHIVRFQYKISKWKPYMKSH